MPMDLPDKCAVIDPGDHFHLWYGFCSLEGGDIAVWNYSIRTGVSRRTVVGFGIESRGL
jgi:hypothetical protein